MSVAAFSLAAGLSATLGAALGAVHLLTLRQNVRLYLGSGPLWRALALHALRLGVTGTAFWAAVRYGGAVALVALLAGFLLARTGLVPRRVSADD